MREEQIVLTPSRVSQYIKCFMDRDRVLSDLLVRGEISNYKLYPSGHHYFTLKDDDSTLRCVLFRRDAVNLRFRPQNGTLVIVAGRVTVFPRDGQYQLYCTCLTQEGAGDLHLAFEQLKVRLLKEGIFDQSCKKLVPQFPKIIALITSPVGAAVQDMLRILRARWPMSQVRVLPVRVQGEGAAEEIAAAIRWANWQQAADLIITGRGGGSMEDLWAFNEEIVAYAIFDSQIPVISAVGHEPDVTIADFVADLRAATPSNAAELAVPDWTEVYGLLQSWRRRITRSMENRLVRMRQDLDRLGRSRALTEPTSYFQNKRLLLDYQNRCLTHGLERSLSNQRERLGRVAAALDALSPLKVLSRGYAVVQTENGRVLASVDGVVPQDHIALQLVDGTLDCRVEDIRKTPKQ